VTDDRSMEQTQELVDVDRLADDLRERAERERRDGPGIDAETPTAASATDVHRLEIRPELYRSTRPVIGPILSFAKHLLLTFLYIPLQAWFAEERPLRGGRHCSLRPPRERQVSSMAWNVERLGQEIGPVETMIDQLEIAQRVGAGEMRQLAERREWARRRRVKSS
jgi:hypothetical protein